MTQREKLAKFMRRQGFSVSSFQGQPFQGKLDLVPYCRKTQNGDTNIITNVSFVMWGGSNCDDRELGCVTFFFGGKTRKKFQRSGNPSEILKKAFCPKSVKEAKETFKDWKQQSDKTIATWKVLL